MRSKSRVLATVKVFLDRYHDKKSPLLLALSGGVDSMALLLALVDLEVVVHAVHIDHHLRAESGRQADTLATFLMAYKNVHFHLESITLSGKNLEDKAREKRYHLFFQLQKELACQAVLIAHHKGDQSETVLKRLFEGAPIEKCGGIESVFEREQALIWRPLLELPKKVLVEFVQSHRAPIVHDPTNHDGSNLRSKMRIAILPELEKQFGKSIEGALSQIGQEARELRDFMGDQVQTYLDKIQGGMLGEWLDLSCECDLHPFLLRAIVRAFLERHSQSLSREQIRGAAEAVVVGTPNVRFEKGGKHLHVDRRRLFILHTRDHVYERVRLHRGIQQVGGWHVEISLTLKLEPTADWQTVWKKGGSVTLPEGDYFLDHAAKSCFIDPKSKPPQFLYDELPAVTDCEGRAAPLFRPSQAFEQNLVRVHIGVCAESDSIFPGPTGTESLFCTPLEKGLVR